MKTSSNPFVSSLSQESLPKYKSPLRKHRLICLIILLLGLCYIYFAYDYEQNTLKDVEEVLNQYEKKPSQELKQMAVKRIEEFADLESRDTVLILTPSFLKDRDKINEDINERFATIEKNIRKNNADNIRDTYLFPCLDKCVNSENPYEELLYMFSLLYASKENKLGKMILSHTQEWSKNLILKESIIREYIENSDSPWDGDVAPLKKMHMKQEDKYLNNDPYLCVVFFLEMQAAYATPFITESYLQEIQKKIAMIEETIDLARRYDSDKKIYDLLCETKLKMRMAKNYAPFLDSLQVSGWLSDHYQQIEEFVIFIEQNQIKLPEVNNMSLRDLINNLKAISLTNKEQDRVFEFNLEEKSFRFSTQKWLELIQRSKTRLLIKRFITQNPQKEGDIFFTKVSSFPDLLINYDNDGTFLFCGKPRIPGRYTYTAFTEELRPVVEELFTFLENFPASSEDKRILSDFVYKQIEEYAYSYRKHTEEYYHSFDIKTESPGALRIVLTKMQLPLSPFNDFLTTIQKNTGLAKSECPYLLPVYQQLEPFQFINKLVTDTKGALPELEKYKAILNQIQLELEELAPPDKEASKKEEDKKNTLPNIEPFKNLLSPAGRLSYPIFIGSNRSYLALTQNWLESVGITKNWQKPFLAPIYQLYDLGLKDIEKNIQLSWENVIWPQIIPLLSKFPFNKNAQDAVSPVELERILLPTSTLWNSFNQLISPVCIEQDGNWQPLIPFRGNITLPQEMLNIFNRLQRLTKTLWDKEGHPVPISLDIKPEPLPTEKLNDKMVILAYISTGDTEAFSFNQKPMWYNFKINWWKEETSKVGIQMGNINTSEKSYEDIVIVDKVWSFHELLRKTKEVDKDVWAWYFPKDSASVVFKIQFSVKKPWELFQIR